MSDPDHLILRIMARPKSKPGHVPTIYFDVPPITPADIVNGKGGWKTLQQVHTETLEEERLRKLDEQYGMNIIPDVEF